MAETVKTTISDQIAAVLTAAQAFQHDFRDAEFYRVYPAALDGKVEALHAAARTLAFVSTHEETIRAAISSAKQVDDGQV